MSGRKRNKELDIILGLDCPYRKVLEERDELRCYHPEMVKTYSTDVDEDGEYAPFSAACTLKGGLCDLAGCPLKER